MNFKKIKEQEEIAEKINNNFKSCDNVILIAPTGWGKSGITQNLKLLSNKTCCVMSHQKSLQDQYEELLGEFDDFITLKGRENYPCKINKNLNAASAPCASNYSYFCKFQQNCQYFITRNKAILSKFLNTNYSVILSTFQHIIDKELFTYKKDIFIFDEAHNFHQIYMDYKTPKISNSQIKFYKNQIEFFEKENKPENYFYAKKIINKIDKIKFIEDEQYLKDTFNEIYNLKFENSKLINEYFFKNYNDLIETGKISFVSILKNFESLSIDKYKDIRNDNEAIFELSGNKEDFTFSKIPLNISKHFQDESFYYSDKKLFMSSTIFKPEKFLKNLGLDKQSFEVIELDSKFPKENRPVYFIPAGQLNQKVITSQQEKLDKVLELTCEIINTHINNNDSGIIFTSSYNLTNIIYNYIISKNNKFDFNDVDILFNSNSNERNDILSTFKTISNKPKLLISPSFSEGINLENDYSRYQIILKVPFPSLLSKYNKWLMENDNFEYNIKAITNIIQSCGRSVRNSEDSAQSYILDKNAKRIFDQYWKYIPKWYKESIEFF